MKLEILINTPKLISPMFPEMMSIYKLPYTRLSEVQYLVYTERLRWQYTVHILRCLINSLWDPIILCHSPYIPFIDYLLQRGGLLFCVFKDNDTTVDLWYILKLYMNFIYKNFSVYQFFRKYSYITTVIECCHYLVKFIWGFDNYFSYLRIWHHLNSSFSGDLNNTYLL